MRKYISEIQDNNFIYPNNDPYQYGVELVQDINNNSVSGTVTNFVATLASNIVTVGFDYTWALNGAEPFINDNGDLMLFSLHMMEPSKTYYKPWRLVEYQATATTGTTTTSGSSSISVSASQMGITTFTNGTYYFEVRMIGHRAIFPICVEGEIVAASPTPTPTPTPSPTVGLSPTPTATPTKTPTPTPSGGGGKSLQIYGRDVSGSRATLTLFYSINGGGNINVPGYTGDQLPSSCSLLYTITGLTTSDNVTIGTSTSCVMNGNGSSSTCPSSSGSAVDYTYAIDAPSIQQVAITIDSSIIP
jgi:hypothetical protein